MVTAIRKVHAPKGPWVTEGGYEYNLALIAAMAAITETGPGQPVRRRGAVPRPKGKGSRVAMLGAAVAGSYLVTEKLNEPAPSRPRRRSRDCRTIPRSTEQPRFEREPVERGADRVGKPAHARTGARTYGLVVVP